LEATNSDSSFEHFLFASEVEINIHQGNLITSFKVTKVTKKSFIDLDQLYFVIKLQNYQLIQKK